jgi:hypothetical protein
MQTSRFRNLANLEVAVCPVAPSEGVTYVRRGGSLVVRSGLQVGSQNNAAGGYPWRGDPTTAGSTH